MLWDILLASGIGISQLVVTWYGVHVSVRENRTRNAVIIGLIGLLGIGLTVAGTIRNSKVQSRLQAQLDKIQQNTEQPPKVTVNVPSPAAPPQHTHVAFGPPQPVKEHPVPLPFQNAEQPFYNIGWWNSGDYGISEVQMGARLVVLPVTDLRDSFLRLRNSMKPLNVSDLPARYPRASYITISAPPLNEEQVTSLNSGIAALCMVGFVTWKDASGKYETGKYECLAEADETFNWHQQVENNREWKR